MGEHQHNVAKPLRADSKAWVAFLFLRMEGHFEVATCMIAA